jgi:hypothetical protein
LHGTRNKRFSAIRRVCGGVSSASKKAATVRPYQESVANDPLRSAATSAPNIGSETEIEYGTEANVGIVRGQHHVGAVDRPRFASE